MLNYLSRNGYGNDSAVPCDPIGHLRRLDRDDEASERPAHAAGAHARACTLLPEDWPPVTTEQAHKR